MGTWMGGGSCHTELGVPGGLCRRGVGARTEARLAGREGRACQGHQEGRQ